MVVFLGCVPISVIARRPWDVAIAVSGKGRRDVEFKYSCYRTHEVHLAVMFKRVSTS
jgi:hypothetical protein